jgi:hypothetical protein
MGCQQPGQIGRIGDAGIHAVSRHRHPQMGCVSANEHPAFTKFIRNQPAANPVLLANYLV